MKNIYSYFTIALLLIIFACNGPKSLTRKGNKLSEAGMYKESSEYFLRALSAKPDFIKAKVALKASGQHVIDDQESIFFKALNSGDKKTAVYSFIEMKTFQDRVSAVKVELSFPSQYQDDFEQVKLQYLDERFAAANELLGKEEFGASEIIFNEIIFLQPDYKDVASLKKYAHIEPIYRRGVDAVKKEKYRAAYYSFQEVVQQQDDYKNAKAMMAEALADAQYTIAFMPFENVTYERGASDHIAAKLMNDVLQNKGPFLKVIDRQNIDVLLKEQKLGMIGAVDERSAANAGNMIGAKAILMGKLLAVKVSENPVVSQRIKGYEAYQVKKLNPQNGQYYSETNYNKVNYVEYTGNRQVTSSFQYKLISTETGEILMSSIVTETSSSTVHYASYDGNRSQLYPGTWLSQTQNNTSDKVYTGSNEKKQLDALFSAPRTLSSREVLTSALYDKIGATAAQAVYSFNPENK